MLGMVRALMPVYQASAELLAHRGFSVVPTKSPNLLTPPARLDMIHVPTAVLGKYLLLEPHATTSDRPPVVTPGLQVCLACSNCPARIFVWHCTLVSYTKRAVAPVQRAASNLELVTGIRPVMVERLADAQQTRLEQRDDHDTIDLLHARENWRERLQTWEPISKGRDLFIPGLPKFDIAKAYSEGFSFLMYRSCMMALEVPPPLLLQVFLPSAIRWRRTSSSNVMPSSCSRSCVVRLHLQLAAS